MAKTTRVGMPQLGESVDEGTISKWRVKPGDKVIEFEPMLEVDTDKVNAEVPAPVTGILREILAKEGETVQAGAEIAVVELSADGKTAATPEAVPAKTTEEPAQRIPSPPSGERVREQSVRPNLDALARRGENEASAPKPAPGEHRYSPAAQTQASELKRAPSKEA